MKLSANKAAVVRLGEEEDVGGVVITGRRSTLGSLEFMSSLLLLGLQCKLSV